MVTQALWFRKMFKINHQYFNTKVIFPSGEEWTFIWTNLKHWMICPRMQFTQGCFVRSLFDIGSVVKLAMYIHNVASSSPHVIGCFQLTFHGCFVPIHVCLEFTKHWFSRRRSEREKFTKTTTTNSWTLSDNWRVLNRKLTWAFCSGELNTI